MFFKKKKKVAEISPVIKNEEIIDTSKEDEGLNGNLVPDYLERSEDK